MLKVATLTRGVQTGPKETKNMLHNNLLQKHLLSKAKNGNKPNSSYMRLTTGFYTQLPSPQLKHPPAQWESLEAKSTLHGYEPNPQNP